jgi:hypothetical protein
MSIIRMVDWVPPDSTTFPTMQRYRQNPDGPYRELLMAEDENGEPIPYEVTAMPNVKLVLAIPHALGIGSQGTQPQAVAAGDARIPDVVIPVRVDDGSSLPIVPGACLVELSLFWNPLLGVSGTGMWADENYVYLVLNGIWVSGPTPVQFVVYVEYTHSVVRNEIVTSEYAQRYYVQAAGPI